MITTTKYKPYPKYKPTGIDWLGDIPEGWEVEKLQRTILPIESGGRETGGGNQLDEGVFSIGGEHIGWMGELILDPPKYISPEYFMHLHNGVIKKEDVLLVKDGATIGKLSYLDKMPFEKCAVNEHVFILRAYGNIIEPKFLFYILWSPVGQEQIKLEMRGAAQPGLSSKFSNVVYLTLPKLEIQRTIINYLDRMVAKIDEVVIQKQKLIEFLLEKRQVTISQAVTKGLNPKAKMKDSGIDWMGRVPAHWEVKKIKRLCLVKRGASPRPIEDPRYFDENGEYGWVRISDVTASDRYLYITEQKLSELGKSLSVPLEPGEIFLSIAGSVGKPIITKIKCCIHDGFVYFHNLKFNRDYLYYIFAAAEVYKGLGKLGTQLNLNTDTIGDIFIPVPPTDEQLEISKYLDKEISKNNLLIKKIEDQNQKIQEFRQTLISNAVTGKVKV